MLLLQVKCHSFVIICLIRSKKNENFSLLCCYSRFLISDEYIQSKLMPADRQRKRKIQIIFSFFGCRKWMNEYERHENHIFVDESQEFFICNSFLFSLFFRTANTSSSYTYSSHSLPLSLSLVWYIFLVDTPISVGSQNIHLQMKCLMECWEIYLLFHRNITSDDWLEIFQKQNNNSLKEALLFFLEGIYVAFRSESNSTESNNWNNDEYLWIFLIEKRKFFDSIRFDSIRDCASEFTHTHTGIF